MIKSEDSHRNTLLLYRKWGPSGEGKTLTLSARGKQNKQETPKVMAVSTSLGSHSCDVT